MEPSEAKLQGAVGVVLDQRIIPGLSNPGCGHRLWAPVFVNMVFGCVTVSLAGAHAEDPDLTFGGCCML